MVDPETRALGRELARLRKDAGLTQGDLGRALGRTAAMVSAVELGKWKRIDLDAVRTYVDHCLDHLNLPRDLGENRRRHVLGLFAARDALSAVETVPVVNQLPRDTAAFTGRDEELARLRAAMTKARARGNVIAVHAVDGKPGVGKTALVVHAGHMLPAKTADRLFLDLHAHSPGQRPLTSMEALARLLSALGVPGRSLPSSLDDRAAMWRDLTADRTMLLILDNALDEEQVHPLLPGGPGCSVLVTSRRRLPGLDAVTIPLDVLSAAEAELMLRRVVGRRLPPDSPVGELVELCGYLPLAITLVGGQLRTRRAMTVGHLVARMRENLRRLEALRDGDQHVAAAFELSYRMLAEHKKMFLRRLATHPGRDLDVYAGAALTARTLTEAERELEALLYENLLDEYVFGRFELHDLIAEYLRELNRNEGLEERPILTRLLDYYQDAARLADHHIQRVSRPVPDLAYDGPLPRFGARAEAMTWLGTESDNLLACLDAAAGEPVRVVEIADTLSRYLRFSGPWDVATRVQQMAVSAARALGNVRQEAVALLELGAAQCDHGDYDEAEQSLMTAARTFADLHDEEGFTAVLLEHGTVRLLTGRYESALTDFRQALDRVRAFNDRPGTAEALVDLGTLHYVLDEYNDAESLLSEALEMYQVLGDDVGRAITLKNLGSTWYFMDEYEQAQAAFEESLALAQELGIKLVEVQAMTRLGSVLRLRGRHEAAVERLTNARRLARLLSDRSIEAELLIDLGAALRRLGRHHEAEEAFSASVSLYRVLKEDLGLACALKEHAELLVDAGRFSEARVGLTEARRLYEELPDRLGLAATANTLGRLETSEGNAFAAVAAHAMALDTVRDICSPLEEALALEGLSRAAILSGDVAEARIKACEALAIYERIGAAEAEEARALYTALNA